MELSLASMLVLCVFISFWISPSVSLHFDNIPRQDSSDSDRLQHVLLTRKLKLASQPATREFGEDVSLNYKAKTSSFSGRVYEKGKGRKEKLRSEEDKMSEFMGMDYAKVRRRRPIHNKSLPTP